MSSGTYLAKTRPPSTAKLAVISLEVFNMQLGGFSAHDNGRTLDNFWLIEPLVRSMLHADGQNVREKAKCCLWLSATIDIDLPLTKKLSVTTKTVDMWTTMWLKYDKVDRDRGT